VAAVKTREVKRYMLNKIKHAKLAKRIRKTPFYSRVRQYLPMPEPKYVDDHNEIDDAEIVRIDWPTNIKKPKIGIVQDEGIYPRWTKYCRFFENNSFDYDLYNIHAHDWIERAGGYDIIVGFFSCAFWHLQEMREKYHFLETYLGKTTYPSSGHANLYEDKCLESYIAKVYSVPFVTTYVSYDKANALSLVENLTYPVVSKIVPASGSIGVELVRTREQGRRVVEQAFSRNGRRTHLNCFRQKNYVYFQDYVPNDGYDIRAITVGKWAFGYYRRVLEGDFRASGMNQLESRELPVEALKIARDVNKIIRSPVLAVDMLRGLDGRYRIIEFSPIFEIIDIPEQLSLNGVPGAYIFDGNESFRFVAKRYWVHELALREFLLNSYLPKMLTHGAANKSLASDPGESRYAISEALPG
jgi:glutathione synthase/RimK-type ligase-like ATP-grasp enzyme